MEGEIIDDAKSMNCRNMNRNKEVSNKMIFESQQRDFWIHFPKSILDKTNKGKAEAETCNKSLDFGGKWKREI